MKKHQRKVVKKLINDGYEIETIRYSNRTHLLIKVNGKIKVPIGSNPPPMKTIVNQIEKGLNKW